MVEIVVLWGMITLIVVFGLVFLILVVKILWDLNISAPKKAHEKQKAHKINELRLLREYVQIGELRFFHKYKLDRYNSSAQGYIRASQLFNMTQMKQLLIQKEAESPEEKIITSVDLLEESGPTFA